MTRICKVDFGRHIQVILSLFKMSTKDFIKGVITGRQIKGWCKNKYISASSEFVDLWPKIIEFGARISSINDRQGIIDYIASYAFYNRSIGLKYVNFKKCSIIYESAFQKCIGLASVSFPNCTYIASNAFYQIRDLSNVYFPKCEHIGASAFDGCIALKSVTFPACLSIDEGAFEFCTRLGNLAFPACTNISSWAFFACSSLSTIYLLGSSFCNIEDLTAFSECQNLQSIYVPSSLYSNYLNDSNWNYFGSYLVSM